jgi:hypothetical protein
MSKLIFGITKIIPFIQEQHVKFDLIGLTVAEAHAELRKSCPKGDLHIHLYVEAESAEEVGAVLEPTP